MEGEEERSSRDGRRSGERGRIREKRKGRGKEREDLRTEERL